MNRQIKSRYLGLISYSDGLSQQSSAQQLLESKEAAAVILGLEHEPVITLGVRGRPESDLVASPLDLASRGFELRQTERGGQATLHSPGQLVIYPCVNLRAFGVGPRAFVDLVQATTVSWCESMGLSVEKDPVEPGLFIDGRKLAAFGFKIARGMTSHGLAINVENDLSHFGLIRTCGVHGQKIARLRDYGIRIGLNGLFSSWVDVFEENLSKSLGESRLTEPRSVL